MKKHFRSLASVIALCALIFTKQIGRSATNEPVAARVHNAERPRANFDEAIVGPYVLPDVLVCLDGTKVADAATWKTKRRPELLDAFAREVYGRTPSGRPAQMHWKVVSVDPSALGGTAVRKEVTIWFTAGESGPSIHLLIYQPSTAKARAPWPVFLGLNSYGNECIHTDPGITLSGAWMRDSPEVHIVDHHATDATRGTQASRWQVEEVLSHGYATATFYYGEICPDREEGGLDEGIAPLFNQPGGGQRRADQWGAIGEWAWGLSRALDYLVSDPDLDARRVAVHGHSRLGKAALWAGAQDERFAFVISNESGSMGAKIGRRNYGQTPTDISIAFPYWFCPNFATYRKHEDTLPIDQHELLALIAPRLLYVASASGDRFSDPAGEFLGLKGAEPVYALFSKLGLPTRTPPPDNTPVWSETLGYHIRPGPHDITPYDWSQYLAFADKYLKN